MDKAKTLHFLEGREATALWVGLAAAVLVVAGAVVAEAGLVVALVALLHVAALTGIAVAWLRADAASKAARKASSDLALLANRLIRIEQHLRAPSAANPALRSTMAEVTGTVGLLGGVVRELARNVAAQNRDVAHLKDTLQVASETKDRPALKIGPETRIPQPAPERDATQPEPSLLPTARSKGAEEEIGRMRLVTQAFEADQIELHLQPVVSLPQRKVRFYETLARLRLMDGTLLGPAEFLPLLERLGRAPEFDRRVLTRAMAVARHLRARGSEAIVGVNLSARSVAEPGFLLSLSRQLEAAPEIMGKVVLEFPQAVWRDLDAEQRQTLALLSDMGVPMSLDQATDLGFQARPLYDLGVRFIKLPADLMIEAAERDESARGPDLGVRDFAALLRREGIRLVAEHVEHEEMVPTLIELGVPLAQGFVFAAPRAVRAEVLGEAAPKMTSLPDDAKSAQRRAG